MSIKGSIIKILRVTLWVAMGLILLVTGLIVGLYSPWVQDRIRGAAIEFINSGDTPIEVSLSRFRLRFPLKVDLSGLAVVDKATADTLVSATGFFASVKLLPLLEGNVGINDARLIDASFKMGSPDSAMYLRMHAETLDIEPSDVKLGKKLEIDLSKATIANGVVAIALNPLAPTSPSAPADPETQPVIKADELDLVDFTYTMSMPPTIDSLGVTFTQGTLSEAIIDLGAQTVNANSVRGSIAATYLTAPADSATAVPTAAADTASTTSPPWEINIRSIEFAKSRALYALKDYTPEPGFDPSYIKVDSIDLHIDNFFNRATSLTLPITSLEGVEGCGLRIAAKGVFSLDSTAMHLSQFSISTPESTSLALSATMGMGDLMADPDLPLFLNVEGQLDPKDLTCMFPFATPILSAMGYGNPIEVEVDAIGTSGELSLQKLAIDINRCVDFSADGTIFSPFSPDRLGGDIVLKGHIINITPLKNKLLDRAMAQMLRIPPTTLNGRISMRGGNINGSLRAYTRKGKIALNGSWRGTTETYSAKLDMNDFPLDAFLPSIPVGKITASLNAAGTGVDFTSTRTKAKVNSQIDALEYDGFTYSGISLEATADNGEATAVVKAHNDALDIDLNASGNLSGATYAWNVDLDARKADLEMLHFSTAPLDITASVNAKANLTPADSIINVEMWLKELTMQDSLKTIELSDINLHLASTAASTSVTLHNRDLSATFDSPTSVMLLTDQASVAVDSLMAGLDKGHINIEGFQRQLPPFNLQLNGGQNNLITDVLHPSGMSLRHVALNAANDSIISMDAKVLYFTSGQTKADTLSFRVRQDSTLLLFKASMDNRPGTFDNFAHVDITGHVSDKDVMVKVLQKNIKGKTGFNIGATAQYADSTIRLSFIPLDPTIAYKPWTINADNFISFNIPHRHLDANLHLLTDKSSLELYTVHQHDHDHDGIEDEEHGDHQEDIILKISNLQLADWLSINPFAPPIKGKVAADMRLNWAENSLNGNGTMSLDSLYYGKERVGDFLADVKVTTGLDGMIRAKTDLSIDGVKTITLAGALNDSTATTPFNLDFSMIHFPLSTVNPFLPPGTARLRGTLNGKMDITGDSDNPIFNGYLDFDSAAVRITMLGADYLFSENPIEMKDNIVTLKDFTIMGVNKKPLVIDGEVNVTNLNNPIINLSAQARDMGLVNTSRAARGADIYGKAFIDLDASVKGDMQFLDIDASLTLLAGTNVTYTTVSANSAIESRETGNLVKFVQFNDTTNVVVDSIPEGTTAMDINAILTIESGSTINVNLGTDGKAQVMSNGVLNYTQEPFSDGRLTGRLNITDGFVRYSVFVLGEKQFDFTDGSYIDFSGNMLNPTLNVQAVDRIRANVTQEGQNSRLVNFDVGLSVTGTLNTMNVAFNLSTDDDITIANELQSMTPEQRANQAMNMLLYNVYTGPGTKGNANIGGNALYSFLENSLNSWAAQNIKGVDLSFGIDQYDKTMNGNTSTTTQYSYKVSKSLFNDRFKIIVGGNYSTDANNDENFSQNLINDISFEYLLNRQGTMYVRLFRHTGYESILEGEVTQTGVGFVYKRKIRTFLDMFRPFKKYGVLPPPVNIPSGPPTQTTETQPTTPPNDDETK